MKALLTLISASLLLSSCGYNSPIEPYATTKSHFMNAPKVDTSKYPQDQVFRVYERAASGFVPVSALRSSATELAQQFCDKRNCRLEILGEKRTHLEILGNFPAIEIIFAAVPNAGGSSSETSTAKLARLKKLRDEGIVSEDEFQKEKTRYLNGGR